MKPWDIIFTIIDVNIGQVVADITVTLCKTEKY